jgi:hypothetical protein
MSIDLIAVKLMLGFSVSVSGAPYSVTEKIDNVAYCVTNKYYLVRHIVLLGERTVVRSPKRMNQVRIR